MKALNITKTIVKICGVCAKTALMCAALPLFVILSSLKDTKPQRKPHILCTYSYANN